jgi:hypothetical protein
MTRAGCAFSLPIDERMHSIQRVYLILIISLIIPTADIRATGNYPQPDTVRIAAQSAADSAMPKVPQPDFSVSFGADLLSSYILRGLPLRLQPVISPNFLVSYKNLSLGAFSVFDFEKSKANLLTAWTAYLGYTVRTEEYGSVLLALQDNYPALLRNFEPRLTNTKGGGYGDHVPELLAIYNGPASFPLRLFVVTSLYNDPVNSWYIEPGYVIRHADMTYRLFCGILLTPESEWYFARKPGIANLGAMAIKTVRFSDSFSIPFRCSVIYNGVSDQTDRVYIVFGAGIQL